MRTLWAPGLPIQGLGCFWNGQVLIACPLCRQDPGRLRSKLEIHIEPDSFNPGIDPKVEERHSFEAIQAHLFENWALLESQAMLPRARRLEALREQTRRLAYCVLRQVARQLG